MPAVPSPPSPATTLPRWTQALVWSGPLACVAGLLIHSMWTVAPWGRFAESLGIAGLLALLAWPLRRWRQWHFADAFALVCLALLVPMCGALPVLAVLVLGAAAIALGSLLTGPGQPLYALLSGLALLAGLIGWLLPLPVHRLIVYAPVLLALIVWRRYALREAGRQMLAGWTDAVKRSPHVAGWAMVVMGLALAASWLPTMQHDDLGYHLGLPWQLLTTGRYDLDPTWQIWTLAPWASDVLHGLAQVLAQAEARGPLNALWLLAALAAMWQLTAALGAQANARWLGMALYASLPLSAALLAGMQTETAATAVLLALAALVVRGVGDARRSMLVGGVLFGLLCGLKPLHALTALPLLVWAGWRHRHAWRAGVFAMALLAALIVGSSSYAYAWAISGNPVLPLFNGVFQSPYAPLSNFSDPRWHSGLGLALPWAMTFDTSRFLEGWDGGVGFVLIATAGLWVLALLRPATRAFAACATVAMLLPLLPMQYARYLHPGMALLIAAVIVAAQGAMAPRRMLILCFALCGVNLLFQANANWLLHTGGIKRSLLALGRDAPMFARYVPERLYIDEIRRGDKASEDSRAASPDLLLSLALDAPSQAEFGTRGRTATWYAPTLDAAARQADADASGEAWVALLRRERVRDVLLRPASVTPAQRAGLTRVGATRQRASEDAEWWRLPEATQ